MKKVIILITTVFISIFLDSCIKCVCDPRTDDALQFKLVNTTNTDLYSGTNALYKIDSLKIFYKTAFGNLIQENTSINKCTCPDSSIIVTFLTLQKNSTYYFYYNINTSDSVNIEWKKIQAKCCGEPFSYDAIQSVKFKNQLVTANTKGIYTFVK